MDEPTWTPLDKRLDETLRLGEELWTLTDGLDVPHNAEIQLTRLYREAATLFRHALRIVKESTNGDGNATTTTALPARPVRRG